MQRFECFLNLLSRPWQKNVPTHKSHDFAPNEEVEALAGEELLLFIRQLLMLSRRRRCATNHLGQDDPFN